MNWKNRYLITSYFRSSLWIVPVFAVLMEQIAAGIIHGLDARLRWHGLGFGITGALSMYNDVVTLSLSFIVFTFSSLLVAIQVASGQYTPRIIATTLLRDNVIRFTVGLFVFTYLFAVKALVVNDGSVEQLVALVTGGLGFMNIVAFLFLIDYAARLLRPVSLIRRVGESGLIVIHSVYPELLREREDIKSARPRTGPVQTTLLHKGSSAIILAVDVKQLVAEAELAGGIIQFLPQVGDFVGTGEPLFLLYGNAGTIREKVLRGTVVFGSERTLEQDPLFALRILVDIGIKALSKAINDPTTAVLAIDQLQRLLRRVGTRNLPTDYVRDSNENVRVIFPTPNWDDFVHLAFSEIRFYGAENIQIARRLRAMILNLADTLPTCRHPALKQELELLDRMLEKLYNFSEDLALARIADSQGLGGTSEQSAPIWARENQHDA